MRAECEILARLADAETELRALQDEIARLQRAVYIGDEGWRTDLELLAQRIERRRALEHWLAGLRWVLAPDMEQRAS